jgi:TolB-like protein
MDSGFADFLDDLFNKQTCKERMQMMKINAIKPMVLVFISFWLYLIWAMPAYAAKSRVVILPFANYSGNSELDALKSGFYDLLLAALTNYVDIELIDRENLYRVIDEQSLSISGLQDGELRRVGTLLQANVFIKGGFFYLSHDLRVDVHVFDVESTRLLFSLNRTSPMAELSELVINLGQDIVKKMLGKAELARVYEIDECPEIGIHYMRGLGAFYSGLYEYAVAEFMQVLDIELGHADAHYWLARAYLENGETTHAKIEFKRFMKAFPMDELTVFIKKLMR